MFILDANNLDELEKLAVHLDTLYEEGEECRDFDADLVSDNEYDTLIAFIRKHRPNSYIFDNVTASKYMPKTDLIQHQPPMTSIAKAPSQTREKEFQDWRSKCLQELGKENYVQAYKLDGVACRIYYEKGKLTKAGLRPRDGVNAEDVTENVKHVDGIPEILKLPLTLSISGELLCYKEDFEVINEQLAKEGKSLRANPRNHTSGAIRQYKDPSKTKEGKVRFIGYSVENFNEWQDYYDDEIGRAIWVNKSLGVRFCQIRPFREEDLQKMEEAVDELPYMVDGIVISVRNLEDQEQMGRHGDRDTGAPRGKIAWKFEDEVAIATIKEIEWNIGRTGRVTPVAIFDGVQLAGTNVQRCTLNNIGWMERLSIGIGTKIKIIKSGAIIPKAIDVVSGKVAKVEWPQKLNGHTVTRVAGDGDNVSLECKTHPATKVSYLDYFLTTIGVKGLGSATVEKLAFAGKIDSPSDFYKLEMRDFLDVGLSKRQALLGLASIYGVANPSKIKDDDDLWKTIKFASHHGQTIPAWKLFAALGIPTAGKTAGKSLIDELGSLDNIRKATVDELVIEGIGEKTAETIHKFLQENSDEIDKLIKVFKLELPKTGKFSGKIFCFSGSFDEGKKYWEEQVETLGGKCSSSVNKKTDYLIAGPGSGSKSEKAKEFGVEILNVDELKSML